MCHKLDLDSLISENITGCYGTKKPIKCTKQNAKSTHFVLLLVLHINEIILQMLLIYNLVTNVISEHSYTEDLNSCCPQTSKKKNIILELIHSHCILFRSIRQKSQNSLYLPTHTQSIIHVLRCLQ